MHWLPTLADEDPSKAEGRRRRCDMPKVGNFQSARTWRALGCSSGQVTSVPCLPSLLQRRPSAGLAMLEQTLPTELTSTSIPARRCCVIGRLLNYLHKPQPLASGVRTLKPDEPNPSTSHLQKPSEAKQLCSCGEKQDFHEAVSQVRRNGVAASCNIGPL